jgi:hypothetical protein|nr:MAG TPA: hypothetical protein [Bacteriophage sp.]
MSEDKPRIYAVFSNKNGKPSLEVNIDHVINKGGVDVSLMKDILSGKESVTVNSKIGSLDYEDGVTHYSIDFSNIEDRLNKTNNK